ncbi:MAG: CoB--CoM heterodisulfide reductase iron-sulfur subunit B family protein [Chloroflexi bacterium]|nr:CoB--CoM heterodisulfide reductase iron-sulfur subunit B family protein [Chloroflexota bacterium]
MNQYAYFPGCSLEKIGLSYHMSALETTRQLGIELIELEDWNCCGATAYFAVDEFLAYALGARNLAMAEKQGLDCVAPCSGCYKNMYFANADLKRDADLAEHINYALQADDLKFSGRIAVRHLMDVFVHDVGLDEVKARVSQPLSGLRVAPYYGCQILRPRKDHEDVENPRFFEDLLSAAGATPVDFPLRLQCCGGALIITSRTAALSMVRNLLQSAIRSGASVIATACPLCQVNLECYQKQVNREFGTELSIPVLYFTQILGLAMGLDPGKLGIGKELVLPTPVLSCMRAGGAQ